MEWAAVRLMRRVGRQRRLTQRRLRGEGLEVVANDLRGEVVQSRLLREAGNVLEIEPVLEAFEGLRY